jgi:catechol 2,3-dioxygenase-like lactoylglutathione lyase family enzyme
MTSIYRDAGRRIARMFDHVTIRVTDRRASEAAYIAVLGELGIQSTYANEWFAEWDDFSLLDASEARPATSGLHIGFVAPSRANVDAFWRVGTSHGLRDAGPPGERPHYKPDYYGAFLLDPDGNSIEAVHHGSLRLGGGIDHLWLRTEDLASSRAFYGVVAPAVGLQIRDLADDHLQVLGSSGSFSVVPGPPTQGLHMAFPATTNAAVDEFHAAVTGAGYRDDGPPGERPVYHAGYYGAFVLDPDGNSVELVNHNRTPGDAALSSA